MFTPNCKISTQGKVTEVYHVTRTLVSKEQAIANFSDGEMTSFTTQEIDQAVLCVTHKYFSLINC